jgi:hypothetical protein
VRVRAVCEHEQYVIHAAWCDLYYVYLNHARSSTCALAPMRNEMYLVLATYRSMFPANLDSIRSKISECARFASTHDCALHAHTQYIAHASCHDSYNVHYKCGEDPLRNVETYSRTQTQTHTQTHRHCPIYSKMYHVSILLYFVHAHNTHLYMCATYIH